MTTTQPNELPSNPYSTTTLPGGTTRALWLRARWGPSLRAPACAARTLGPLPSQSAPTSSPVAQQQINTRRAGAKIEERRAGCELQGENGRAFIAMFVVVVVVVKHKREHGKAEREDKPIITDHMLLFLLLFFPLKRPKLNSHSS